MDLTVAHCRRIGRRAVRAMVVLNMAGVAVTKDGQAVEGWVRKGNVRLRI